MQPVSDLSSKYNYMIGKFIISIALAVSVVVSIDAFSRIRSDRGILGGSEYVLNESGRIGTSPDEQWWVNSGGRVIFGRDLFETVHGSISDSDPWRLLYAKNNPLDTDNGYHPQNILRLVNRGNWRNLRQEAYFRIDKDELSRSPNRNASNGVFLFNRYVDGNNLYYTGLRVDGAAVIKKKIDRIYYTLDYRPMIAGRYDPTVSPNLLPHGVWIGVRSEVVTTSRNSVNIKVYADIGETGNWIIVAEATDNGTIAGPINDSLAHAGIRTDFMDVSFKDYKIEELSQENDM